MLSLMKKSMAGKLKKLIYPLAFILVVILSVLYKLVFKGRGDFFLNTVKGGKTGVVTSVSTSEPDATSVTSVTGITPSESTSEASSNVSLISVYICGEVNNPGIYKAPRGVLLNDIIEEAGGLTKNASVNNINFVYQITSNMSIYIPSDDEIRQGFNGGDIIRQDGVYVWGNSPGQGSDSGGGNIQPVNINTASVDELKALPGIGEVTAKAIADYRKTKPFKSIEDIKNVTGIGESKYKRIKDYICV